jgi:DNA polymerase III psi subunit
LKTSNFEYPYYNIPETEFPTGRCIGNNARCTLVLVEQKDFEEHGVLLTKILRSVELDFERDISFISMRKDEYLKLLPSSNVNEYDHVLLFGISPDQIGLTVNARRTLLKLEHLTVIVSPPLDTIGKDASAKRILWEHLKNVFRGS